MIHRYTNRGRISLIAIVASMLNGHLAVCSPAEEKTSVGFVRSNGIFYLELKGRPEEMGLAHGTAFKKQIRDQVAEYHKQVAKSFGEKNGKRITDYAVKDTKFQRDIKKFFPHIYAEMEGIAKGADVPINDILLINMYEEVFEGTPQELNIKPLEPMPQGKCTTLNCAGRKGLPNLNAQNLDFTTNLDGAQLVIHYTYSNGLKILLYTFVGQVGGIGVNNQGLSMVCNSLPEGSRRKNDGLGGAYITRGLLEQGSVEAAVKWLKGMPQYGSYNYSIVDNIDSVMVEFSPKGLACLETPKEKQFRAHANHMLALQDRNPIEGYTHDGKPVGDVSGKTIERQATADKKLEGKGAIATVDDLKAVLTAAPINNDIKEDYVTIQSIIVVHDTTSLQMFASAGNDPKRIWNIYKFK